MTPLTTYPCRNWHHLLPRKSKTLGTERDSKQLAGGIGRVMALLLLWWGLSPCLPLASATFRPEIGTRALGMSGAFISNADDPTGALWNPAGPARLHTGSFIYDFSQGAFSLGAPIGKFGILGLSVLDLNRDDRFFIKHPNNPIGTFERGYNQVILSYARAFGASWQVGGNIGYNRAPYIGSKWKPNYDLGVIVGINPHLTLGARLLDISGVAIPDENNKILTTFDQEFAFGATWEPTRHFQLNSVFAAPWQFRTGVEAGVGGLSFRLGSVMDLKQPDHLPNWSLGFSVDRWGKQLHYAYLEDPDLKYKHLLSVGFSFGSPAKTDNRQSTIDNRQGQEERKRQVVNVNSEKTVSPTNQIARQYGIEIELILALVEAESEFDSNAISPHGAVGLMQLKPQTAQELGLEVPNYPDERKPTPEPQVGERFHPLKNLEAGVKYLRSMLEQYDGQYVLALAAYNAGPGNVPKNGRLMSETERHVGKVLNNYYQYKANPELTRTVLQQLDAILSKE
ncbi:lytic transglycosylase domain-containing protein [Candidatus Poribacteria bacterium]|nr:lytic transglycosylase domain-containing protein [Candidatus Poribacteria bacterium]